MHSVILISFFCLHYVVQLTGTKLGCGEGGCGACTVMVSKYCHEEDAVEHISVNACLAPLCSVDGMAVTTVEGIGTTKTGLHPCQVRIVGKCISLSIIFCYVIFIYGSSAVVLLHVCLKL